MPRSQFWGKALGQFLAVLLIGCIYLAIKYGPAIKHHRQLAGDKRIATVQTDAARQQKQFLYECAEMRLNPAKLKSNLVGKDLPRYALEIGLKPYEPDGQTNITSLGWHLMQLDQRIWLIKTGADRIMGGDIVVYVADPLEHASMMP